MCVSTKSSYLVIDVSDGCKVLSFCFNANTAFAKLVFSTEESDFTFFRIRIGLYHARFHKKITKVTCSFGLSWIYSNLVHDFKSQLTERILTNSNLRTPPIQEKKSCVVSV